jgi:hypothetical protein
MSEQGRSELLPAIKLSLDLDRQQTPCTTSTG